MPLAILPAPEHPEFGAFADPVLRVSLLSKPVFPREVCMSASRFFLDHTHTQKSRRLR